MIFIVRARIVREGPRWAKYRLIALYELKIREKKSRSRPIEGFLIARPLPNRNLPRGRGPEGIKPLGNRPRV